MAYTIKCKFPIISLQGSGDLTTNDHSILLLCYSFLPLSHYVLNMLAPFSFLNSSMGCFWLLSCSSLPCSLHPTAEYLSFKLWLKLPSPFEIINRSQSFVTTHSSFPFLSYTEGEFTSLPLLFLQTHKIITSSLLEVPGKYILFSTALNGSNETENGHCHVTHAPQLFTSVCLPTCMFPLLHW